MFVCVTMMKKHLKHLWSSSSFFLYESLFMDEKCKRWSTTRSLGSGPACKRRLRMLASTVARASSPSARRQSTICRTIQQPLFQVPQLGEAMHQEQRGARQDVDPGVRKILDSQRVPGLPAGPWTPGGREQSLLRVVWCITRLPSHTNCQPWTASASLC